jgi:hypothetical protein
MSLAPTNLFAAPTETGVALNWQHPAITGTFKVYRSTDGTNFTLRGSQSAALPLRYTDPGSYGQLYYYRATYDDGSTESAPSNVDTATPGELPAAVVGRLVRTQTQFG